MFIYLSIYLSIFIFILEARPASGGSCCAPRGGRAPAALGRGPPAQSCVVV